MPEKIDQKPIQREKWRINSGNHMYPEQMVKHRCSSAPQGGQEGSLSTSMCQVRGDW